MFSTIDLEVKVCHVAAQQMKVDPSEPVYRSRLQTTLSCFPQRREMVSVKEKTRHRTMSGEVQGDERKRTTDEVSKTNNDDVETGTFHYSRISPGGTCVLPGRRPA
jgi:hypothetical protein